MDGLDVFGSLGLAKAGADGVRGAFGLVHSAAGTPCAQSAAPRVLRTVAIDREMKVQLVNGLSAAMGLIATNGDGVLCKAEQMAGVSFTILLSN